MNTLQSSSPQLFSSQYNESYNHPNNHIQIMKKSSKSVSRYLESSSMLYSPNKLFIDETMKNQRNAGGNSVNANNYKEYQQQQTQGPKNADKDETKSAQNYQLEHKSQQPQLPHNNLGKVVSRLQNRLDGVEVKIASLTNIVKLLQKYSQTKDDQYEKQKENMLFAKNVGERVQQIESLEIQNKMKEFNAMSKQLKREIEEVHELRHKLENNVVQPIGQNGAAQRQQGQVRKFTSNRSKKSDTKSPTSQGSYLDLQDLATAFEQMEQRLRDEINKKMEICLKQIKKISVNSAGSNEITGIDQNLFEEQINSLNFAINKIENECTRNKMLLQNQIEELMNRIPSIYHTAGNDYMQKKYANKEDPIINRAVRDRSEPKSTKRSHSRRKSDQRSVSRDKARDKSKSNIKHNNSSLSNNQSEKLIDKKRLKEQQLQQAIRRKKQIKEKLKNSQNVKNF